MQYISKEELTPLPPFPPLQPSSLGSVSMDKAARLGATLLQLPPANTPLSPSSLTLSSQCGIFYPLYTAVLLGNVKKPFRRASWIPPDRPPSLFSSLAQPFLGLHLAPGLAPWSSGRENKFQFTTPLVVLDGPDRYLLAASTTITFLLDAQPHLHCPFHHAVMLAV